MYMPLVASEDGIVQFVKQPGVSLEPGDILGILTLDDPARVKHAKPFEGLLPSMGHPNVSGSKPHQRLAYALGVLNDILDGFDNQAIMAATLKELFAVLHEPELPYSLASAVLSTLSGRMPTKLEDSVRAAIDNAKAKGGNAEFPALRIKKLLEHHMEDNLRPQDRTMFRTQLSTLFEVVEQYQGGLKAHEVDTIAALLARYEETEKLFGGSIEARVLSLREQNKDNLDQVVSLVLSHIMAPRKSKLVIAILDHIKISGLTVSNPESRIYQVMQGLANLEARSSTQVSLKAREVLIACQMPSYEERKVQMENILKSSVRNNFYGEQGSGFTAPSIEVLRELIDSRYTVYDVLPTFFNFNEPTLVYGE